MGKANTTTKKTEVKEETPVVKPTLVARQEFIDKLANLINTSGLPLIVIQPIMIDVTNNVNATIQQQYEAEKKEYMNEIAKKADKESA